MSMRQGYVLRQPIPASAGDRSFWIKQLPDDKLLREPALNEHTTAEVAIVGGGLTGLWTAWRILERAPTTEIVVLEADFCGAGASGRNGGQVHSWFNQLPSLCALLGCEAGMQLARASRAAIDELEDLQEDGTLEMNLERQGWFWVATTKSQLGAWDRAVQIAREQGEQPFVEVGQKELHDATGTVSVLDGIAEPDGGSLDPFLLVRSLRKQLLDKGVRIYESSPVAQILGGARPVLRTPRAMVSAERVLLASNAWAGSIPELNRYMFAFDAQVITTRRDRVTLDELGLRPGIAIGDSQAKVNYWLRTRDDRLLIGRGSGIPIYRDRIGSRSNRDRARVDDVVAELHRLYPALSQHRVAHDWIGSVDFTASRLPLIGRLRREPNIAYCVGWSGTALAQIPVVAKILAELLVPHISGGLATHPLVNSSRQRKVVREPVRYLGSRVVKRAVDRASQREIQGAKVGPVLRGVVGLVPKYRPYDG